jgi:Cu/Ag efflux protein CusF
MTQTIAVSFRAAFQTARGEPDETRSNHYGLRTTVIFAMSIASAQQANKGVVMGIDEPSGTISIQETAAGTVGASTRGTTDSFRVNDGLLFNALHLGDKVAFSAEAINGVKTITRLNRE